MSAPIQLREASRLYYQLRSQVGWDGLVPHLRNLSYHELDAVTRCWQFMAHQYQLRPPGADKWLNMGGRGSGKTRGGAEDFLDLQEEWGPGFQGLITSKAQQRDIEGVMIFGSSGLVRCAERRGYTIGYNKSKDGGTITFPGGGTAKCISADSGEAAFRGPEFNACWLDEIAKWNEPLQIWKNIVLFMRAKTPDGRPPQYCITTTPKRASPIIHYLLHHVKGLTVTTGSTLDNRDNIVGVEGMLEDMDGTAFGRQEIYGEYLEGTGAMVSLETINAFRSRIIPDLWRRVVSFDPAIMDKDDSDDHGIIGMGVDRSKPMNAYVLSDQTLASAGPDEAALTVVRLAHGMDADIVVEMNQGGRWIESHLRVAMERLSEELKEADGIDREIQIPIVGVWAKQAKEVRAEPVGALYELGRVRHCGIFHALEGECVKWIPGLPSPNRMDALVHGVTHLLLGDRPEVGPIESYFQ